MKFVLFSLLLVFYYACRTEEGSAFPPLTFKERFLVASAMYPTADWAINKDDSTGKITILFKYPFTGTVPAGQEKRIWDHARAQAQLICDFVFADSASAVGNVLFCYLIDGKRENSYCDMAIPYNLLRQPATFSNTTQQRMNRIVTALPGSSSIKLDSSAGVLLVRLNGEIYNMSTIENYDKTANYFAVLIYSYIFLRDNKVCDLYITFEDTSANQVGQTYTYQYHRTDSLFQRLHERLLPDLEQIEIK